MTEKNITRIMYSLIGVGLLIAGSGVALIVFTDIAIKQGVDGVLLIAGLIAFGLFISVPAKIYLTLQLMKYNDKKLREENQIASQ